MPSGGARARSGPAPDPNALRRNRDAADWITLPAAGRPGPPPEWPLTRPTKRELALWAKLWAKPQGVAWEALGQEIEVALYTRRLAAAERAGAPVAAGTLVRQLADSLGLTVPGMDRNRWKISYTTPAPVAADQEAAASGDARVARRSGRLRVVPGDGDE